MSAVLRVGIAPVPHRHECAPSEPLLDPSGATVILGTPFGADALAVPVEPSARTLFGPRGACVCADGSLWVADTGHHRLLGWSKIPTADNTPADWLVGQPDFGCEGRNAHQDPSAATLNVPTGICACGEGLVVADAWNHRVLIWRIRPDRNNQPADVVLGQCSVNQADGNRGLEAPSDDTMHWPSGVCWDGERLWVADTGNRRVLMWNGLPLRHGAPADLVLGQDQFSCRDENGGGAPTAASMRWPHGLAVLGSRLFVSDAGNNRVMIWNKLPTCNGQPCDVMLGQHNTSGVDHNCGDYWPDADVLNMPYAISMLRRASGSWLVVADTASSRLLGWHADAIDSHGAKAQRLAGQFDWQSKGDNRWLPATRDSLCWPYGLSTTKTHAVIADAGNNRVLLWRWHDSLSQESTA